MKEGSKVIELSSSKLDECSLPAWQVKMFLDLTYLPLTLRYVLSSTSRQESRQEGNIPATIN